MEENNFGYGFEHDDYGRFEQDIDQDTAYVIRPEQMGGGASPQPQIKRTIPIVTIALIVANVIAASCASVWTITPEPVDSTIST